MQRCGSVAFLLGTADLRIRDPDAALFVSDLQDAKKNSKFVLLFTF
jgi:hypothetical protein